MSSDKVQPKLSEAQLKQVATDISKGRVIATFDSNGVAVVEVFGVKLPLFQLLSLVAPYETPTR